MGRRLESRAKNWAETISICIVSVRKKDIQGEKGGGERWLGLDTTYFENTEAVKLFSMFK